MLKQDRVRFHNLSNPIFSAVARAICHESITAFPIYECVKIFARLTAGGKLTYARHPHDLGTTTITSRDITNRFSGKERSEVVLEALSEVEENIVPVWPFAPGSASWLQLEILDPTIRSRGPINPPTIVVRKAVRIKSLNNKAQISSSPLLERMFNQLKTSNVTSGKFNIVFSPSFKLKNMSGSGVLSESFCLIEEEGLSIKEVAELITCRLINENTDHASEMSPGFYVEVNGNSYKVVSDMYSSVSQKKEKQKANDKKLLPPLMPGILK